MGEEFHGEAAIQVQRLQKSFGDHQVLKNVSFSVPHQGIHGLVGLSGAGKSTILNCLIGYYDIDAGKILINGRPAQDTLATEMGFTTQDNCFYEDLSLKDNINYFGDLYDVSTKKLWGRAKKLLKVVNLDESLNLRAEDLSGGMKRRFDLVLSLLHDPEILILDEPATGLDPMLRHKIWKIVKYINKMGVTTIISSHLLKDLEKLCTQISLLHNGTIVTTGSPQKLRNLFSHEHQFHVKTKPGRHKKVLSYLQQQNIEIANPRKNNHKLVFDTKNPRRVLQKLNEALRMTDEQIMDLKVAKPGLESLMEEVA